MKLTLVDVQQGNDTEDYLGKRICLPNGNFRENNIRLEYPNVHFVPKRTLEL